MKDLLLKNYRKLIVHALFDAVVISLSLYLSFWLRVGDELHTIYWPIFLRFLPLYIPIRLLVFYFMGVYKIFWRFVTSNDAMLLAKSVALSSAVLLGISYLIEIKELPRSVFIMEMIISTLGLMGSRLLRRQQFERSYSKDVKLQGRRTLIYGAGFNGRTLAKRFKQDYSMRTNVIAFLDDDPEKLGKSVESVKVYGTIDDLANCIENLNIEKVIISITDPSGELIRNILAVTKKYNIKPQIVSTKDSKNANLIRSLELKDLLNRPQRHIDFSSIRKLIEGQTVLVTGAGGSIGSELARQIWSFGPRQLLLLDHNEFSLYAIDNELRLDPQSSHRVIPLLIDLKDSDLLETALREHKPSIVFHAAAYKHVHLVQANPFSAILNNILGTKNLYEICESLKVKTCVLISTDKAVNPVGVMGATKRVCEMMTTAMGQTTKNTYCAVRFGNVLGSSGSLIPLIQKQIQEGGPVTVTHQDMTRYFMLIPEAVSLVLNAAILSKPGDLQVLKMGEPIKILDIVKSLISYMGFSEDEMPIEFIGLRPGEKMFEELYISGKELKTDNPDILTVPKGDNLELFEQPQTLRKMVFAIVNQLCELSQNSDKKAIEILNEVVHNGLTPFMKNNELLVQDEEKRVH
ncbi:MAG: polysaccharide biosynthesis protein [Bdellovibrionales bacterium]|nr:polysaccharide biosynthesis protein [Bdellovibrionales bacterium]